MKNLIRKILKESEDEFDWVQDLVPADFNYPPGAIYYKFGDSEEVRGYILKKVVGGFVDLKLVGDRVILETDGWCDFADLFYDDHRGTDGYVNRYVAKKMLCDEDGDWWNPYDDIISNRREWKSTLWDDNVIGNDDVITEILNHIKKNYVSKPNYNPNQLDIFGELPKKQNVVNIKGRILDDDYFYELKNDLDLLGDLINQEEEFSNLRSELRWAYDDAYNTAARDQVWSAVKDKIEDEFGAGKWLQKDIQKPSGVSTKHYMEFDITNLFWSSTLNFFYHCLNNRVGKESVQDYTLEELEETFEECMTPAYEYSNFLEFYSALLDENGDEFNPRYQNYPDDGDIQKYFTESVSNRI